MCSVCPEATKRPCGKSSIIGLARSYRHELTVGVSDHRKFCRDAKNPCAGACKRLISALQQYGDAGLPAFLGRFLPKLGGAKSAAIFLSPTSPSGEDDPRAAKPEAGSGGWGRVTSPADLDRGGPSAAGRDPGSPTHGRCSALLVEHAGWEPHGERMPTRLRAGGSVMGVTVAIEAICAPCTISVRIAAVPFISAPNPRMASLPMHSPRQPESPRWHRSAPACASRDRRHC